MISKLTKCKTCGFKGNFQNGTPACSKLKIAIDPENDFCSWHISENSVTYCDFCKTTIPIKDTFINYFGDKMLLICQNCNNLLGTCHTCVHMAECNFRNDHTEPQMVMKTVRQGMMMMQTQVKNPNLIKKHCTKCNCSYGTNGECLKEVNGDGCQSWQLPPELLQ